MLAFVLLLVMFNLVGFVWAPADARSGFVLNLLVTGLLLVNHLSACFLSERGQRQMMIPPFALAGAVLVYILVGLIRR